MDILGIIDLGINAVVGQGISDKLAKIKNEMERKKIISSIGAFQNSYEGTVLDSLAFETFLKETGTIIKLFRRVFELYRESDISDLEFISQLAKEAIEKTNLIRELNQQKFAVQLKDEDIVKEYFEKLLKRVKELREDSFSLQQNAELSVITEVTRKGIEEIIGIIQSKSKINPYAEDKIERVEKLIDERMYSEAEALISESLEKKEALGVEQQALIYWDRAKIFYETGQIKRLANVRRDILEVSPESIYATEIDLLLAINDKNEMRFREAIEKLKMQKYSLDKITYKEAWFMYSVGDFLAAENLLLDVDGVKREVSHSNDSHYLAGVIFLGKGRYNLAQSEFEKAIEIHNKAIYRLLREFAHSFVILRNFEMHKLYNELLINDINSTSKKLESLKNALHYLEPNIKARYYEQCILIKMLLNPEEALIDVEGVPSGVLSINEIRWLKSKIYYFANKPFELMEVCRQIYDVDNTIAELYIIALAQNGEWNRILEICTELGDETVGENLNIRINKFKAMSKLGAYGEIKIELISLFMSDYMNPAILLETFNIVLDNKDDQALLQIHEVLRQNKESIDINITTEVAKTLARFERKELVRELVIVLNDYNEPIIELMLWAFKDNKCNKESSFMLYEILKTVYNKGYKFGNLLLRKAELEIEFRRLESAISTLEEYKIRYRHNINSAFSFVVAKIGKNEYIELADAELILLQSNNSSCLQLIASLRMKQLKFEEAEALAIRSMYLLGDNAGKEVMGNFVSFSFEWLQKLPLEESPDRVVPNTVIVLKNDVRTRRIAIHKDEKNINQKGEIVFDCENYFIRDEVGLYLIGQKCGKTLNLDDGLYKIIEIVKLRVFLSGVCTRELQLKYKGHGYFEIIEDEDVLGLAEKMKSKISVQQNGMKNKIALYNFEIESGVPISALTNGCPNDYLKKVLGLFYMKNQLYYAGELTLVENSEYVVTLSSLILMLELNLGSKLHEIESKCHVSVSTLDFIKAGLEEAIIECDISGGFASISDSGELVINEVTSVDRNKKREFWTELMQLAGRLQVCESYLFESEIYDNASGLLLDADIDSSKICNAMGYTLVSDDLFVRKIHKSVSDKGVSTNFVGVLLSEKLLCVHEQLELIDKLVRYMYLYPLDLDKIIEFCTLSLTTPQAEERRFIYEKLQAIIDMLFAEETAGFYNNYIREMFELISTSQIPLKVLND